MTVDEIVLCSMIDKKLLTEHDSHMNGNFKSIDELSIKSLKIALVSCEEEGFEPVCKVLMMMPPLQMSSFLKTQIEANFESIAVFTSRLDTGTTRAAVNLKTKIQSMNTLSIVKNTLVDTNIINLKKTISTHDNKTFNPTPTRRNGRVADRNRERDADNPDSGTN